MPYHYAEGRNDVEGATCYATVNGWDDSELEAAIQKITSEQFRLQYGHMLSPNLQDVFFRLDRHCNKTGSGELQLRQLQLAGVAQLSLCEGEEIMEYRLKKKNEIADLLRDEFEVLYDFTANGRDLLPELLNGVEDDDDPLVRIDRDEIARLSAAMIREGEARYLAKV